MIRTTKYNQRKTRRTNKMDENFAVLNGEERGAARLLIKYFNKADKENACILFEENGFRYYTNKEAMDVVYDEKGAIVHTKPLILFPVAKPKGVRKPKITVMAIDHSAYPTTIGNLTDGAFFMIDDNAEPVKGNVILRKPTEEEMEKAFNDIIDTDLVARMRNGVFGEEGEPLEYREAFRKEIRVGLVPEPSEVYPTGKKPCGNCGKCKCPNKDTQ